jgi:cupin superfamily acireductone dioxygenase involved in methionine salvage
MGSKWLEKIKSLGNEDLLSIILKRETFMIEAAKEVLARLEREEISSPKIYQRAILQIKPKTLAQKIEVEEIKEKIVQRFLKERLEEEDLLFILDEVESQELKEKAAEKFLSQEKEVKNYVLGKIIQKVERLKNEAAKILLKQNPSKKDLLIIEEECRGALQLEAFEIHKRKGLSKEDGIYISWAIPNLAEFAWKEIKEKKLSLGELFEICKYTDSEKIAKEAAIKMWQKRLKKPQLLYFYKNPQLIESETPEKVRKEILKKLLEFNLTLEELMEISESQRGN